MKKKIILSFLILGLNFPCTAQDKISKEDKLNFKTITEASYSAKRSGELLRKDAFSQNLDKKEIYDDKGNLIEIWKNEVDGTIYQKIKLLKNNEGKLVKSSTYDKNDNLKRYTTTKFNYKGKIVEYKTFNSNDKLTYLQNNEFDSRGNLVLIIGKNIISNRIYKTTSEYNAKNLMIKETDFKTDGSIRDVRTFKYDEKGNGIESELTRPNGDYTKFISEFDKNDNLTVQNWFDKDGKKKHQTSFVYIYDRNNNWITKKGIQMEN